MGHMYPDNICKFFIRRLYAKGKLSVKDCVEGLIKAKEKVSCAEGASDEPYMLAMAVERVVHFLSGLEGHEYQPGQREAIIVPVNPTPYQQAVIDVWTSRRDPDPLPPLMPPPRQGRYAVLGEVDEPPPPTPPHPPVPDMGSWDVGADGNGGEYGVLDSVEWQFGPGWRKKYPDDIPILGTVTS